MKVKYIHIALLAITVLFIAGCSNKKNTFMSRQYHDVTAYFNVLFNGREAFKDGVKKAERYEPAGFDELLPVFSFEYEGVPGLVSSDMQRTVEKTNKTVTKHSITAKPKRKSGMSKEDRDFYNKREFNIYIDDTYLLMAKANVFLRDYSEAKRLLDFAVIEYPKESSILETRLWNAIVQVQLGDLATAENTFKLLEKEKEFPVKLRADLDAAWADLRIKQENYPEAISYLEKALENVKGKQKKIRYSYIIAQLYGKTGNKSKSAEYYDKVLKKNPPYFTAFNAQMAKAFTYDSLTQKDDIRKILTKAMKDRRNEEYLDQIYYALATVEMADNNVPKALEYYQKSISAIGLNDRQKALSYNALADYYLGLPDYIKAYRYYDSAANTIGTEHSRYNALVGKTRQLKRLAENLEIIHAQDSLQRLANLSDEERNKIIEDKIQAVAAAEEAQKMAQQQEEQQRASLISQANRSQNFNENATTASGSQWYFYNPTALSLGYSDFQMRWGRRKLEDNWRRRNKSIQMQEDIVDIIEAETEQLTLSEAEKQKRGLTAKDKEYYLLDIPTGAEEIEESNKSILRAMFNVGEAYRDDLLLDNDAINAFEDLLLRFPNSTLQPMVYIALYNLYTKHNENDKATYYRNMMAQQYPDNQQVRATLDPTYITQLQAQEKAAEGAYMSAVYQYSQGNYQQALQAANQVIVNEPDNILLPQYYLLRALSTNYMSDSTQYRVALGEIIDRFPNNDAAVQAKELLLAFDGEIIDDKLEMAPEESITINYSTADSEYFFAIYVNNKVDAGAVKFNVTARNLDLYLNENYEIGEEDMGSGNKLITVGIFKNKEAAMKYYQDAVNNKASIMGEEPVSAYTMVIISDINLMLLKDSKFFRGYNEFFKQSIVK